MIKQNEMRPLFMAARHPWDKDGDYSVLNAEGQSIATCSSESRATQIVNALNTAADKDRQIAVLTEALEATSRASRQTLDIIQKENFIFDGSGDRWEKLAFTIYTELTQASTDAKDALAEAKRIQEGK